MSITPDALEQEFSLTTAVSRLVFLSRRDSGEAAPGSAGADVDADDWSSFRAAATSLDVHEALELLALGEVVARKAHDSQLTGFRAALRGGASWEQIARALDVAPGEAWAHFSGLVERQERSGALDAAQAAAARELAGPRPA